MSFTSRIALSSVGILAICGHSLGAEVTLRMVDREGHPVRCWVRVFQTQLRDREYASAFHDLRASGVDSGTYNFELEKGPRPSEVTEKPPNPWLRAWGEVTVAGPTNLFVIVAEWANGAMTMSVPPVTVPTLEGTIEPHSRFAQNSNWIRFNAVYDTKQFDVDVDAAGRFRVWDNLDGVYLLTVISGSEILGTQMVSFRVRRDPRGRREPNKMVLILASPPPEMMRLEQGDK